MGFITQNLTLMVKTHASLKFLLPFDQECWPCGILKKNNYPL